MKISILSIMLALVMLGAMHMATAAQPTVENSLVALMISMVSIFVAMFFGIISVLAR